MSRFVNLELGGSGEEDLSPGTQRLEKDASYYFNKATAAFENMDFEESLRMHSKVLEHDPGHAAAWTGQVLALIELGEFREARMWADKALELFPKEAELLAAKGVALGRLGELDGAMAFSDAAVEEGGQTPYVWLARADVLLCCKESRAEFCLEKALAVAAGNWFVAWLAARIRFWHRQFMLALNLAQRAVEWNPGHAPCWLMLADCQQAIGMVGPARDSVARVEQLRPRWSATLKTKRALDDTGFFRRVGGSLRTLFSK